MTTRIYPRDVASNDVIRVKTKDGHADVTVLWLTREGSRYSIEAICNGGWFAWSQPANAKVDLVRRAANERTHR